MHGITETVETARSGRRDVQRAPSRRVQSPLAERILALQRTAGNRAAGAALARSPVRSLQRLVLTTDEPLTATDSPRDIAAKHEVDITARALAVNGQQLSHIDAPAPAPPLDANMVNYVVGHSGGRTIGGYGPDELAERLIARGMTDGMVVRLVGCYTGVSPNPAAGTFELARQVLLLLSDYHGLDNVAVKGALGELTKTKRKGDPGPGTSGIHEDVSHNYVNALAKQQNDLMRALAPSLARLAGGLPPQHYPPLRDHFAAILAVCSPGTKVPASDQEWARESANTAALLAESLPKAFKRNASLKDSEDAFNAVIGAMSELANSGPGDQSGFRRDFQQATQQYLDASKQIVGGWLGGVGGSGARRRTPGNITFKSGNPALFAGSNTYTGDLVRGDVTQ